MYKYKCNACGYVFDPKLGDSKSNIPPDTAFEDLPGTWVCPVCGAGMGSFHRDEPPCIT